MLQHLHIENYALIDSVDLEFRSGFNLLTGETGSGKSIVVEALGLLLGEKASSEVIRSGADRARITGVFAAPTVFATSAGGEAGRWSRLLAVLSESGFDLLGEDLVLQRDILPGGKSRVFVNHQPATVGLARSIAPYLAEVHGQNEQQELFSPAAQLEALDRFGGLRAIAAVVRERFGRWKHLWARQEDLTRRQQERLRQMELWRFQKREIEEAGITAEGERGDDRREDQRLEEEKLRLTHAARIEARLAACYDLLYDAAHSATASIGSARKSLEEVAPYDAALEPLAETLASAKVSIEDVALAVRDHLSRLDRSPGRLDEVENRRALLDRLKRKYGPTLDDVARHRDEAGAHLREAETDAEAMRTIEREVAEAAGAFETLARELSGKRAKAAKELKRAVEGELRELAMQGTVFEARLTVSESAEGWSATGMDRVEFNISPNPGEPLRSLARIASGGELSRIMLALEITTDARQEQTAAGKSAPRAKPSGKRADRGQSSGEQDGHTLVFDEVDSGIGGRAAETVGRKLRELGASRQVLCVTHLPQIASFAHHHFRVEKVEQNGRTVTRVERLDGRERVTELARMLSGSQVTESVLKHAAQLLKINS